MFLFWFYTLGSTTTYTYSTSAYEQTVSLNPGTYYIDCWGANGGSPASQGAFISVSISITDHKSFILCAGQTPDGPEGGQENGGSSVPVSMPGQGGGGYTAFHISNRQQPVVIAGSGGGGLSWASFSGAPGGLEHCTSFSTEKTILDVECATNSDDQVGQPCDDQYMFSGGGGGAGYKNGKGGQMYGASVQFPTQCSLYTPHLSGNGGSSHVFFDYQEQINLKVLHQFRGDQIPPHPIFKKGQPHGTFRISKVIDCSQTTAECSDNEDCLCSKCPLHCARCNRSRCLICEEPYDYYEESNTCGPLTATFSISSFFSNSQSFSGSFDFTKTTGFSETSDFSRSQSFSESSYFSESLAFSKSLDLPTSSMFTESSAFSESLGFSKTMIFTETCSFSVSPIFTKSFDFTKSVRFTKSFDFTRSFDFTKSVRFTESFDFTKSIDMTELSDFTESFHVTQTASEPLTVPPQENDTGNKNIMIIVGSIIGVVVVVSIIVIVFILIRRRKEASTDDGNEMKETVIQDVVIDDILSDEDHSMNSEIQQDPFLYQGDLDIE